MSHSANTNKHTARAKNAFADVPKNEKGGILVTEEDISIAFQFLDKYKQGKITPKQLLERLQCFLPSLTKEEVMFTMGDEKYITAQYLTDLLLDNTITHFDPVAETFKAYDPEGTGYVDGKVLQEIFQRLGLPELSNEDIEMLHEKATENWYTHHHPSPKHHSKHHHHPSHNPQPTEEESHDHPPHGSSSSSHHPVKKINLAMFRQLLDITSTRKPSPKELGQNTEDY